MATYYTYNEESKELTPAKRVLVLDGMTTILGAAEDFAKYLNAYTKGDDTPPAVDDKHRAVHAGYYLVDGKWASKWRIEPIVYTPEDYDNAMEDYIRSVRVKRGYTTREPSDYINSAVPRWRQDAADYIAFRDAVMVYALAIINEYSATGNAPSLEEFKAGFPKIEWTYDIGDET